MAVMAKQDDAFLTIGELAAKIGVPQHILRYWETRFPALRPLQRSGNRRYYRPEDVALAQRIYDLLNVEGYTIKGAQQALSEKGKKVRNPLPAATAEIEQTDGVAGATSEQLAQAVDQSGDPGHLDRKSVDVEAARARLNAIRGSLLQLLEE